MIPKASQRGGGADLAAHLRNAHDNEQVIIAELRGCTADDIAGAFAEWEVQAFSRTRCDNYLYSLSINPDHRQGLFTREQYLDYMDRIEQALGLAGQPRAVVFHVKDGREHAHVVWSRIDTVKGKAIHMPFDHLAVMAVTRQFAREHGIELPKGYETGWQSRQLTLYEKAKQEETGLTREDHAASVTEAWQISDSPRALVNALQERGYILATGKRPYVLVDIYGGTHALPRLLGREVRLKQVREFLDREFPLEKLPTVDEAKKLVKQFSNVQEAAQAAEQHDTALAALKRQQAQRPERAAWREQTALTESRQKAERQALAVGQRTARQAHGSKFITEMRVRRIERAKKEPKGLAGFLGRVSGMNAIRRQLHQLQDRKRLRAFRAERNALRGRQRQEREELKQKQILEKRELERRDRALRKIENREKRSLTKQLAAEQRLAQRGGKNQLPSVRRGRSKSRTGKGALSIEANTAAGVRTKVRRKNQLRGVFGRAAGSERKDKGTEGQGTKRKRARTRKRTRKRDRDRER